MALSPPHRLLQCKWRKGENSNKEERKIETWKIGGRASQRRIREEGKACDPRAPTAHDTPHLNFLALFAGFISLSSGFARFISNIKEASAEERRTEPEARTTTGGSGNRQHKVREAGSCNFSHSAEWLILLSLPGLFPNEVVVNSCYRQR